MTKTTKLTWTGDIKAALEAVDAEQYSIMFNDRHKTCRRLKFATQGLTDEQLRKMQEVIQERRPELNVTVARWDYGYWNTVVYYRPRVGVLMNH